MDFIQLNDVVNVQAYKFNGDLYRQYNGLKVIKIDSEYCVLLAWKTKVAEVKNQKWVVKEPTFWFFSMSSKKFFNTMVTVKDEGFTYYVNLASPFVFEDKTLKYIDYDIDIKVSELGKIKILDLDEFVVNSKQYKYSLKQRKSVYDSIGWIFKMVLEKEGIFSNEKIQAYYYEYKKLFENEE